MKKRKFKRGERITSVNGAKKAYKAGRWIYLDGELLHPNSYSEISFGSIKASIKANRAYLAELVEEEEVEEVSLKEFAEMVTKGKKVEWISQEDYDAWVKGKV